MRSEIMNVNQQLADSNCQLNECKSSSEYFKSKSIILCERLRLSLNPWNQLRWHVFPWKRPNWWNDSLYTVGKKSL